MKKVTHEEAANIKEWATHITKQLEPTLDHNHPDFHAYIITLIAIFNTQDIRFIGKITGYSRKTISQIIYRLRNNQILPTSPTQKPTSKHPCDLRKVQEMIMGDNGAVSLALFIGVAAGTMQSRLIPHPKYEYEFSIYGSAIFVSPPD